MHSESIVKILPAIIAARGEFTTVRKDSTNPHFSSRFASMTSALDACEPALGKHGLAVLQTPHWADGMMTLVTKLAHTSGEWISSEYPVIADYSQPQKPGAAMTYARRYTYLCIVGVAPEDDDGETASGRGASQGQRRDQPQRPAVRVQAAPAAVAVAAHNGNGNGKAKHEWHGKGPGTAGAPAATTTQTASGATEKQQGAIKALVLKRSLSMDTILNDMGVEMLDQLTGRQAADVISRINGTDGSAVFGRDE